MVEMPIMKNGRNALKRGVSLCTMLKANFVSYKFNGVWPFAVAAYTVCRTASQYPIYDT